MDIARNFEFGANASAPIQRTLKEGLVAQEAEAWCNQHNQKRLDTIKKSYSPSQLQ